MCSSSSSGIVGYSDGGRISNCIALNSNITVVALADNVYTGRIVGSVFNNTALSNNYAKAGIVVKKGASADNLNDITIFIDKRHGAALELNKPEDLLNAWVIGNRSDEKPYLTWAMVDDKLVFELFLNTTVSLLS